MIVPSPHVISTAFPHVIDVAIITTVLTYCAGTPLSIRQLQGEAVDDPETDNVHANKIKMKIIFRIPESPLFLLLKFESL